MKDKLEIEMKLGDINDDGVYEKEIGKQFDYLLIIGVVAIILIIVSLAYFYYRKNIF